MIIILMGLPGSGKSTLAQRLVADHLRTVLYSQAAIVSADDFFTNEDGSYDYVRTAVSSAHLMCRQSFVDYLKRFRAKDLIVVDNTNLKSRDRTQYVNDALAAGHELRLILAECCIERCIARRVGKVPADRIREMAATWQPPAIAYEIVYTD